jgi:branched-chain amino acid transport system permease protein
LRSKLKRAPPEIGKELLRAYQAYPNSMQILLNGLITGVTLGLTALAFAMVFVPTRHFHVSFSGLYTISPFIVWSALRLGFPWPLAIMAAVVSVVMLSLAIEIFNHAPLKRRGASSGIHLVSSLGLFIVLTQISALLWGSDTMTLRSGVDQVFPIGNFIFSKAQIFSMLIGVSLLLGFFAWLRWSGLGLKLRGLSSNETELVLRGHNVRNLRLICFGISGGLCACSSVLVAYDTGFSVESGLPVFLLVIVATIVGGRNSFIGPVIGAILVVLLRSEVAWFFSARWQDSVTFLFLVVFLIISPAGLIGRRATEGAD